MSDISSAGIARRIPGYGKTCRKDVLRGVDVPVVAGTASGARPVPRGQGKLREQVPACRAGFARRIPPVDHDQFPAVPLAFVRKLPAELTPAAVADGAGETPVADHVLDGEILDHDHVVLAYEPGAGPVQVVAPGVTDLTVGAGNLGFRLGPVRGTVLAAGQASLVAGQITGLAFQVPGIRHPPPVAGHGEVLHAQVGADGPPGLRQRFRAVAVDHERHVPAAIRLPGDNHHCGVEYRRVRGWPGPYEPQRGGRLRQPESAVFHAERRAGVVGGLPGAAGLEPGIAGTPGEERGKRFVLVPQRLLKGHGRDLVQERQVRVFLQYGQRPVGFRVRGALALPVPAGLPPGQRPVPHHADAAERAVQHRLLLSVGVGPAPVRRPHAHMIASFFAKTAEARRMCLRPVMLPRVAGHRIPPRPEGRGILRRSR